MSLRRHWMWASRIIVALGIVDRGLGWMSIMSSAVVRLCRHPFVQLCVVSLVALLAVTSLISYQSRLVKLPQCLLNLCILTRS